MESVVIGGLEPFLQFEDLLTFVKDFRAVSEDDIVIYTGYYASEIDHQIDELKKFKNIIIKFGRYVPNKPSVYDKVLGITLASNNQKAFKIS